MATNLFNSNLYTIKTLTNLHVGNGEANYSVIDKQVQRDPITGLPQINASSLKGALREFIEINDKKVAQTVFGYEPNFEEENNKEENPQESDENNSSTQKSSTKRPKQGYVNFFDAKLLALPVRTDKEPFIMATSKEVLVAFIDTCNIFGIEAPIEIKENTFDNNGEYLVENDGWKYNATDELDFIGKKVVVLQDEDFRELAKELPFVARNYLENGKSENLWYEEIVPRESLFYFVLQYPKEELIAYKHTKRKIDETVLKSLCKFAENITNANLFIGANTTVGYGYCHIEQKVANFSCSKEATDAE